jgi:hypothetical protein
LKTAQLSLTTRAVFETACNDLANQGAAVFNRRTTWVGALESVAPWGPGILICLLLAVTCQAQQGSDRQSEAYRASVAQETLRQNTDAVQAQLAEVAEAMRQLLPNDVAAVDRALKQMDSLSRREMETTIQALRDASRSADRGAQLTKIAGALKDQTKISSTLKQLAIDLDARQSLDGIGTELSALLRRQVAAQTEIARLGRIQAAPKDLRNHHRQSYDVVNEDQKALAQDVALLARRLDGMAANLKEESLTRLVRATNVARERKLVESEQNAARLTNDGPLPTAADLQNECAKTLVLMEQAFAITDPMQRIAALGADLKKLLDQQKDVTDKITAISQRERTSVPDDLKRVAAGLGNQVAALRAELQPLNSAAANNLQQAQDDIDKAQLNYARMWEERADARANTQAALDHMQAAAKALDQQAAQAAAAAPATSQQLVSALEALRRETEQAAITQARVQPGAAPPFGLTPAQQQALQEKVNDLQRRALPIAPEASQVLGTAAGEMAQPAPESQHAAAESLAKAAQLLAQQEQALAGNAPGQQALKAVEDQIAQAGQKVAETQQDMQTKEGLSEAFKDAAAAQQQIAAAAQAAAKAGAPPETAADLQQAAQAMAEAQKGAAEGKAAQAQAAAQAAQQALGQAKAELGGAQQAMAAKAGAAQASKAGNAAGERQEEGGVPEGQGNGGGGKTGDFLKGAGAAGEAPQVVSGLSPHDRDAISQLQNEKPPADYAAEVQQYYKNIADAVAP